MEAFLNGLKDPGSVLYGVGKSPLFDRNVLRKVNELTKFRVGKAATTLTLTYAQTSSNIRT